MIEQRSEHFQVGENISETMIDPSDLVAEARLGTGLARALVQHVVRMKAAGYDDDVVIDGEVWHLDLKRKAPPS